MIYFYTSKLNIPSNLKVIDDIEAEFFYRLQI